MLTYRHSRADFNVFVPNGAGAPNRRSASASSRLRTGNFFVCGLNVSMF